MIHYQLRCGQQHEFDGWFKDSASFESQAQRGLLECPVCGDVHVDRALMAPAVPRKKTAGSAGQPISPPELPSEAQPSVSQPAPDAASGAPIAVAEGALPDRMRAALQRLRAEVEKNCDYVGDAFADEARRIHRGETQRRGIYGETTPEQAETLQDEGIAVARIPWVPRADG